MAGLPFRDGSSANIFGYPSHPNSRERWSVAAHYITAKEVEFFILAGVRRFIDFQDPQPVVGQKYRLALETVFFKSSIPFSGSL